jgi:hypothetical protein
MRRGLAHLGSFFDTMTNFSPFPTELDEPELRLWNEYIQLDRQGRRHEGLGCLQAFIAAVNKYPADRKESAAASLCRFIFDGERIFKPPLPLVRDLLFPAMLSAYRRREPDTARWLACLIWAKPHISPEIVGDFDASYQELLATAIRQDSGDAIAQRLLDEDRLQHFEETPIALLRKSLTRTPSSTLLSRLDQWFSYVTHHVDVGLLVKDITDCDNLLEKLDLFCELAVASGQLDAYRNKIDFWRFHFQQFRDRLTHRNEYRDRRSDL